ncbi:MAG: FAD binding domain-containing protein [Alphaproteobacteria bacterium]
MAAYARPLNLDAAVDLLAAGTWRILAGGTDFYPAQGPRPITDDVLDISAIGSLRGIEFLGTHWRIGAGTTWSDLLGADLPGAFDGLKAAAREVGACQIQNAGTIVGNICNASPAADGVPPLLTLDAQVEVTDVTGQKLMDLDAFITGPRQTHLAGDGLVTAITIPAPQAGARSAFIKLGARHSLVISIAMAAVLLVPDSQGKIAHAGVAVGACSPVARRLPDLEATLVGEPMTAGISALVDAAHFTLLAPIDDVRASADYRSNAAVELVRRALEQCARGRH